MYPNLLKTSSLNDTLFKAFQLIRSACFQPTKCFEYIHFQEKQTFTLFFIFIKFIKLFINSFSLSTTLSVNLFSSPNYFLLFSSITLFSTNIFTQLLSINLFLSKNCFYIHIYQSLLPNQLSFYYIYSFINFSNLYNHYLHKYTHQLSQFTQSLFPYIYSSIYFPSLPNYYLHIYTYQPFQFI